MNNKEAIQILKGIRADRLPTEINPEDPEYVAFRLAIKVLEEQKQPIL